MKITRMRFLLLLLFMTSALVYADEKKIYKTKRANPHPPVIDGKLTDPVWESVPWAGDFIQRQPFDGKPATQKTAFKILYDNKNIYVGIRAYDTEPDKIAKRMARRDQIDGDLVGIQLDTYYDHRTAFTFLVNAAGVKIDGIYINDGEYEDWTLDPVWYVKTSCDEKGWTAEMRIPLSQLRFGKKETHVWGLEVARLLYRKEEISFWQPIAQDAPGFVHLFGELHGIEGIKPPRHIELLPYSVGKTESMKKQPGNPFVPGRVWNGSLGLDGKIGVTSNLTLDFTVNPDFGQVEADPSVVNLTAFETFYKEKRPFFIEGKNILDYRIMMGDGDIANDNLFYSRRIGKPASYYPSTGPDEYVKMPENSSILTALKLTGKTKSGFSIGIMDAVTAREQAIIDNDGKRRYVTVEPMTNYFLGRLQKDFRRGATTVGFIVTNTYRDIKDDNLNFLNRNAVTGGFDFNHEWNNRSFFFSIKTVFSYIQGSKDAILLQQLSSRRYYQRPDANHVSVDSSLTSLSGHGGSIFIGKTGKGHFNYVFGGTWRSPGLELNDMGYLRESDMIIQFQSLSYRWWEPFAIFRSFNANINQWSVWDFGLTHTGDGGNINFNLQFKNYWFFGMGVGINSQTLSTTALRGGPALLLPSSWNAWVNLRSDPKKLLQFTINGSENILMDDYSKSYSIRPGITWRPSNRILMSFNPFYSINKMNLQYVETLSYDDDKRYIFASIKQNTLGVVLRLNLSITPNLTIQYYGQPFVSGVDYSTMKYITNPKAKKYSDRFHTYTDDEISYNSGGGYYEIDENRDGTVDYYISNPDFNFREFNSNLVIRWEYIPGSTIYFVWSQGRTGYAGTGEFSFTNDVTDLFRIYPHDVFLIKINKWFSL